MSSWVTILEGAALLIAGATLCYLLLWWKDRNLKRAKVLEADSLLNKARNEAELISRDARLAAGEEAKKLRDELEQSFAARRLERTESERRLAERETLLNSQLERMVEAERSIKQQKELLEQKTEAQQQRELDLETLTSQARQQLQKMAGPSAADAQTEL